MAMAFASQALKDALLYGGTPEWLEDEDDDFWRSDLYRAIQYTGFLGTPEIIVDHLTDMLKATQDDSPGAALLGEILGVAPALSIAGGDIRRYQRDPAEGLTRIIPFAGDVQWSKQQLYQAFGGTKVSI